MLIDVAKDVVDTEDVDDAGAVVNNVIHQRIQICYARFQVQIR